MSSSTCNLDPNGVAPAEFINPNVVPQQAITALAAQSPRVYGCVQFTQVGSSTQVANGQWWCATTTPSDERKSLGRATNCAVTTKEQACQAPWVWVQKQRPPPGQDVGAYVFGCTRDDGKFICQGGQSCSPQGLSSSGEPVTVDSTSSGSSTTGIVIGVSILVGCLLVGGLGFFFWKRTRNHRLPASSPSGPGGVAAAYAGAKVVVPPSYNNAIASPRTGSSTLVTQSANYPGGNTSSTSVNAAGYPISSSGVSSGGGSGPGAVAVIALNTIPAKPQRSNSATSRGSQGSNGGGMPEARLPVIVNDSVPPMPTTTSPRAQQGYLSPREAERARLVAAPSPILDETDLVTVPVSPNMMAQQQQAMSPQMMAQQQQQHPQYASGAPTPVIHVQQGYPQQQQQQQQQMYPTEYQSHLHHSPAAAMSPPPTASSLAPGPTSSLGSSTSSTSPYALPSRSNLGPASAGISFVPARPSLSEPALPSLSGSPRGSTDSPRPSGTSRPSPHGAGPLGQSPTPSAVGSTAGSTFTTEDEVFPRPYRTYVNMDAAAPVVQAEQPGKGNVVPALPAALGSLSRSRHAMPSEEYATYYALDFKLPLTAALRTQRAAELCASKGHLPGYAIDDLVATYEQLQVSMRDLVAQSFARAPEMATPGQPSLADQVFASVTGGAPMPPAMAGPAGEPNQAAFLSRLMQILLTDVFVTLTNPLQVGAHLTMLKKHLPELKKDLKEPEKIAAHKDKAQVENENPIGLSAHLLFVVLDHCMSSPSLASPLLAHLRPLLVHARNTLADTFHAHGVPSPAEDVLDNLLHVVLDWFLRLKREYPGVGLYVPVDNSPFDAELAVVEGGGLRPEIPGVVAFTTCFGLWDGSIGSVGFFARVWTKPDLGGN
ncbi:hypothetical protein BCR44DRAFT_1265948 [Catenaria anguillulae PL171]|uniref:Uncharacterized protein n=1 Tax=Catenaria anguillulae PL171 TaxID=765915 RepID=A0A1Y2HAJ0_9FUNG|nr:hypothetical protein BCR44DRAFT_1265948 [Catenaria anguillulae PL171]